MADQYYFPPVASSPAAMHMGAQIFFVLLSSVRVLHGPVSAFRLKFSYAFPRFEGTTGTDSAIRRRQIPRYRHGRRYVFSLGAMVVPHPIFTLLGARWKCRSSSQCANDFLFKGLV